MGVTQFLTRYWYLTAGVVGVLSGVAVASLGDVVDILDELWFMPGLIFGIFSGAYFFFALPSRPASWKLVLWGVFSSLSFFLAVSVGIGVANVINLRTIDFATVVGGAIGVLVVSGAFHFLFLRLNFGDIVRLFFVGAMVPMMVTLATMLLFSKSGDPFPAIFITWQTGVILLFARKMRVNFYPEISPDSLSRNT